MWVVALMVFTELLTTGAARDLRVRAVSGKSPQSRAAGHETGQPETSKTPAVAGLVEGLREVWSRHNSTTVAGSQGCSELTSAKHQASVRL